MLTYHSFQTTSKFYPLNKPRPFASHPITFPPSYMTTIIIVVSLYANFWPAMYQRAFEWLDSNGLVHTCASRMYVGDGVVRRRRITEMDRCLEHESLLCHEEAEEEEEVGGGRGGGGGRRQRGRKGSTFVHVRLKFSVGFEWGGRRVARLPSSSRCFDVPPRRFSSDLAVVSTPIDPLPYTTLPILYFLHFPFFLQLLFVAVVFFLFILVERWIRDKSSLGAGDSFPLFVTLLFQRMVEFSETEYFGQVEGGKFFLQPVC